MRWRTFLPWEIASRRRKGEDVGEGKRRRREREEAGDENKKRGREDAREGGRPVK